MKSFYPFVFILFSFFYCIQLSAQSNGFFGNWEESNLEQFWDEFNSIEEWQQTNDSLSDQGFRPIDFEYYQKNGIDTYFGLWEENNGVGYYLYYWFNLPNWLESNNDLTQNKNVKLIEFEKVTVNGADFYFGIWSGDQMGQETKIVHNVVDFIILDNEYKKKDMVLSEFEFYEDINGKDHFFGTWHPVNDNQIQQAKFFFNLEELENFEPNEGFSLIEFEEFKSQGLPISTFYKGVWENRNRKNHLIATNSFEEWELWEAHFKNKGNLRLVDFEKFNDEDFYPILPKIQLITDDDLVGNTTYNWTKDTEYILSGAVKLEAGGVLNIEAGTVIKAQNSNQNNEATSLSILQGAQIFASGTASDPIQFIPLDNSSTFHENNRGSWKGISIKGANNFCSGMLSYVSIQFAGQKVDEKEIGALILENVDECTDIHHIEVYASGSDGIQLLGGNVNLAYSSVTFVNDDAYDWDRGWHGDGLFWFAYMGDKIYGELDQDKDYAIEAKANLTNPLNDYPRIYNGTFIGATCGYSENPDNEAAFIFKDNAAGLIANSIFVDFPAYALEIEDLTGNNDSYEQLRNGKLNLLNNVFWNFGKGELLEVGANGMIKATTSGENSQANFLVNHLKNNFNVVQGEGIAANRGFCPALDPRPHSMSHYNDLTNASYPSSNFFKNKPINNQKGAFETEELWLLGWTILEKTIELGANAIYRLNYAEPIGADNDTIIFQNRTIQSSDTIKVACENVFLLQSLIEYFDACPPTSPNGQIARARRRGNKRLRPNGRSNPEDQLAFIETWTYAPSIFDCDFIENAEITILIIDTIAPVIHLIPDANGQLTAFVEDCDEADISAIYRDTQRTASGLCVFHTFKAEDYSGNQSSLEVKELINASIKTLWYADLDGDGFGNPDLPLLWNGALMGFVSNDLDCNDNNPNAFPGREISEEEDWNFPAVDIACLGADNFDICKDAKELPIGQEQTICTTGILAGSTPTIYPILPNECNFPRTYRDIWFKAKVPASGNLSFTSYNEAFSLSVAQGLNIEVFTGDCMALDFLDCFQGKLPFGFQLSDLEPNTNLYLKIAESSNFRSSDFSLCVSDQLDLDKSCMLPNAITFDGTNDCITGQYSDIGTLNGTEIILSDCFNMDYDSDQSVWFSIETPNQDSLSVTFNPIEGGEITSATLQLFQGDCKKLKELACINTAEYNEAIKIALSEVPIGEKLLLRVQTFSSGNFFGVSRLNDLSAFSLTVCSNKEENINPCEMNPTDPACNSGDSLAPIFEEYPWLLDLIDPLNCEGVLLNVFESGIFQFIHIVSPENEGQLYFQDGTFYCQDASNYDCVAAYRLTKIQTTWSCATGPFTNQPAISKVGNSMPKKATKSVQSFNIFPNPSTGRIYIELGQNFKNREGLLTILDTRGLIIKTVLIDNQPLNNLISIDINEFVDGLYWVQYQSGEQNEIKRVILNKK